MQMVMYMKVNGSRIKHMDLANTSILIDLDMRAIGRKISSMGMVEKYGLMEQLLREIM